MSEALSHPYWKMVMKKVLNDPKSTATEKDLAGFCLALLDRAADHPGVQEYLTDRAQKAMKNVA